MSERLPPPPGERARAAIFDHAMGRQVDPDLREWLDSGAALREAIGPAPPVVRPLTDEELLALLRSGSGLAGDDGHSAFWTMVELGVAPAAAGAEITRWQGTGTDVLPTGQWVPDVVLDALGLVPPPTPEAPEPRRLWTDVLAGLLRAGIRRGTTRSFPDRRRPDRLGVVPGRRSRRRPVTLLLAFAGPARADIVEHVDSLPRVQAAIAVYRNGRWRAEWISDDAAGPGHPDLRGVFARDVTDRVRPDLFVCVADAASRAPEHAPPGADVLWVLTDRDASPPAAWGRVARR